MNFLTTYSLRFNSIKLLKLNNITENKIFPNTPEITAIELPTNVYG